jgi:Cys-tRNA(Pro)/Cys-tRNA(Cys) deacylase
MAKKLHSMRWLDSQGVQYDVMAFPDTVLSAVGVAEHFGLSPLQVYKTLVVMLPTNKLILVLIAAPHEIHLKQLAQALGEKRLRMATHKEAEMLTGLKVGGISALALQQRRFPVYIDRLAAEFQTILVSAGQRGMNLRLAVADLVRVTAATFVDATAAEAEEAAAGT